MAAYYNEIDPKAAAWLRELIKAGHIASGEVDERSIVDVRPDELRGFAQCHFFAGIGVWSYALRLAGWADDRPVWTGSCPCQPFSEAGKGLGFADERHLWPFWFHLIEEREPVCVFGEQSASAGARAWLDLVQTDMEARNYAFGAIVVPAAGYGAPHGRHRTWFVAAAQHGGYGSQHHSEARWRELVGGGASGDLADHNGAGWGLIGRQGLPDDINAPCRNDADGCSQPRSVAAPDGRNASAERLQRGREHGLKPQDGGASRDLVHADSQRGCGRQSRSQDAADAWVASEAGPTNGFWRAADWLPCTDGKARPVEPGTFPLAHGAAERVGRLRGYGNAIVAEAAKEFIQAYNGIAA